MTYLPLPPYTCPKCYAASWKVVDGKLVCTRCGTPLEQTDEKKVSK